MAGNAKIDQKRVKKLSMTRSYAAFVAVIALVQGGVVEARYGRLNAYLVEKVPTDETSPNIQAALDRLRELGDAKQSFLSKTPIRDLKEFTALQQVIQDTKCDHTAYAIVRANERASGLHRRAHRRIDKVVSRILSDHAKKCLRVHPIAYQTKKEQLGQLAFKRVEELAGTVINKDILSSRYEHKCSEINAHNLITMYIKYHRNIHSFVDVLDSLKSALMNNADGDPDAKYLKRVPDEYTGKRVVHKERIRKLSRKYLLEPCKQFVALMGPDLFVQAEFDMRHYYELDDHENKDYYLGWSYFKVCRALTADESVVLDDVVNAVARDADR